MNCSKKIQADRCLSSFCNVLAFLHKAAMPSATIMSPKLRESIESEVQEIRRAIRDSFRQVSAGSNHNEEDLTISSSRKSNDEDNSILVDHDGSRLHAPLSTHLSDDGEAPSGEEPCSQSETNDRPCEQVTKEGYSLESSSQETSEYDSVEQETDEDYEYISVSNDEETDETYDDTYDEAYDDTEGNETGSSCSSEVSKHDSDAFNNVKTPSSAVNEKNCTNEIEGSDDVAFYHKGATDLFMSLEEQNWAEATRSLHRSPHQAKIWVVRTKSKAMNDWNCLWKRLPLHEAVRQHAPLTLIDLLVQAYSGACRQCTQFGELPLHIALDSGADPKIVHLLLLHHVMAFQITDQSGRMPLELLNDARQLNSAEHRSLIQIFNALKKSWKEIQSVHQQNIKAVEDLNAQSYVRETYANAVKVQAEVEKQNELRVELEAIKQEQEQKKDSYEKTIHQLETELVELKKSLKASQIATARVSRDMEDAEVSHQHEMAKLKLVLKRAGQWRTPHADVVRNKLDDSVRMFVSLQETLSDHRDDLEALLENIGVEAMLPPSDTVDGSEEEWTD